MRATLRPVCVAALAALASCESGFNPDLVRVQVHASPDSQSDRQGAPLLITVSNSTDEAIHVAHSTCPGFDLLGERGEVVGPALGYVCNAVGMAPTRVEPGTAVTLSRYWFATSQRAGEATLPAGRYTLRVPIYIEKTGRIVTRPVEVLP